MFESKDDSLFLQQTKEIKNYEKVVNGCICSIDYV